MPHPNQIRESIPASWPLSLLSCEQINLSVSVFLLAIAISQAWWSGTPGIDGNGPMELGRRLYISSGAGRKEVADHWDISIM
jgi:hypothetical protein